MPQSANQLIQVNEATEVARLVDVLMELPGAFLVLDDVEGKPQPVVVVSFNEAGDLLLVDITPVREVFNTLKNGMGFRLVGYDRGERLKSGVLRLSSWEETEGRLLISCEPPETFGVLQRRNAYRAQLRLGVECEASVICDGELLVGFLKDLSLTGCLMELSLQAAAIIDVDDRPLELRLCFPDGTRFSIEGVLRHHKLYFDQRNIHVGFEFVEPSLEQDRELTHFVREIEREGARHAGKKGSVNYAPSTLFQYAKKTNAQRAKKTLARNQERYPTPMAKNLGRLAEFLDGQVLRLKAGGSIDSAQLSSHADKLLDMMKEDREAVLFALNCLPKQPLLIRHCLSVAVRLVDVYVGPAISREQAKAIAACGMLHDLGKCLLPAEVREAEALSAEQHQQLTLHVELLIAQLVDCSWLSSRIIQEVIGQANERQDGSGYPGALKAASLTELACITAIVDVVDVMVRGRAGRSAQTVDSVCHDLLLDNSRFDEGLVKRYVRHFGVMPVGTLLRYEQGELAWVKALGVDGLPEQVQLTEKTVWPTADGLGVLLEGAELAALGKPVEIVIPSDT
jgi:HD-GYP domain-containing protein (c-di-GMP phosphodiesterase class II)